MKPEGLLARIHFLVRPYGLKKLAAVVSVSLLHALLQVAGVTSVFPFFAIATDPEKFRQSDIGLKLSQWLPQQDNTDLLLWAGLASLLLLILSSVLSVVAQFLRSQYAHGFAHWLRTKLIRQIASQPYPYFLDNNPAILNKKLNNDVHQFSAWILQPLLDVVAGIIAILLLVTSILWIDLRVSLGAMFIIGGFYLIAYMSLAGQRKEIDRALKHAVRETNSEALNFLNGIKSIRIFGAEQYYIDRFDRHSRSAARMNARLPVYITAPKQLIEPVIFGTLILYMLTITGDGGNLTDTLPTLSVIALAGYRMIPAVQLVYARLSQISAMQHTLDELFDEIVEIEAFTGEENALEEGRPEQNFSIENIILDEVAFSYPATNHPVLGHINLTISQGDAIAISGPSGSGKSTLIDILLGLQRPTFGTFLVNGQPLSKLQTRSFQSRVGYVQQDSFLTNESVRANVAFGIPDTMIDETRLAEACANAQILEAIEQQFEQGFDTIVGDRGVKLSGGQKQRIALARALYRQPEILILDEATSALDDDTESLVAEALDKLQGKVILIVITHRKNTIRNFPRKYQLIDGELVALETSQAI